MPGTLEERVRSGLLVHASGLTGKSIRLGHQALRLLHDSLRQGHVGFPFSVQHGWRLSVR
jgi:hypothetical protein